MYNTPMLCDVSIQVYLTDVTSLLILEITGENAFIRISGV